MRRKGERKLERTWPEWDCGYHPVRHMIATGDGWLEAWTAQSTVPWAKLSRGSGVPVSRIADIKFGAPATAEEVEAFAAVWKVDPAQVRASISLAG